MASTPVKFARKYDLSLTAKLQSVGGTGTPNAAGYACTDAGSIGLQALTITEALVGAFYLWAYDTEGEIAFTGFVVLADDTTTYFAVADLPTAQAAASAAAQAATAASNAATAASQATTAAASAATAATQASTAAAEVVKIPRAAAAVTAGGVTEKHLESSSGATLETAREVIDGNA